MLIQLLQTLSGCVAYAAAVPVHGVYLSCSFFLFFVFGAAIYANKSQGCPGYQLGPEAKYNDRQHSG